jgi:hypothetical protein
MVLYIDCIQWACLPAGGLAREYPALFGADSRSLRYVPGTMGKPWASRHPGLSTE